MANQPAFHESERAGARAAPVAVDMGLRASMLRVCNYMAGGLALLDAVT